MNHSNRIGFCSFENDSTNRVSRKKMKSPTKLMELWRQNIDNPLDGRSRGQWWPDGHQWGRRASSLLNLVTLGQEKQKKLKLIGEQKVEFLSSSFQWEFMFEFPKNLRSSPPRTWRHYFFESMIEPSVLHGHAQSNGCSQTTLATVWPSAPKPTTTTTMNGSIQVNHGNSKLYARARTLCRRELLFSSFSFCVCTFVCSAR